MVICWSRMGSVAESFETDMASVAGFELVARARRERGWFASAEVSAS